MPRRLDHRAKSEPVIIIAAWIDPLGNLKSAIVADPLTADADSLDVFGAERRKINVDQRARRHRHIDQRRQNTRRPCFGSGESHRVGHPFARIALAQRDRADPGECALHRGRNRARIGHVLTQIGAAVDPRQDQVGGGILHHFGQREHHCIGRRSGDRKPPFVMPPKSHRVGQRERMAGPRLFLGRGDDPDVVRQGPRNGFEHRQAACVEAIVVGEQYPHAGAYAGRPTPVQPPLPQRAAPY